MHMQDDRSRVKVEKGPRGKRIFLGKHFPGIYFTVRECEIAQLLEMNTYGEIGALLEISRRTVEFYAMNMKRKLHCQTKREMLDLLCNSTVLEQLQKVIDISHLKKAA